MTRFAFPGNSRQSGAGLSTEPGVALSSCSRRGAYIEAAVPSESSRLTLEYKHSNWSSKWRGVSPLPSLGTVLDSLPSHGSSYLLLLSC